MSNPKITVRPYDDQDYEAVKGILEGVGIFNPNVDSQARLAEKIGRDPRSIFVAIEDDYIVSTASIIDDGRMASIVKFGAAILKDGLKKEIHLEGLTRVLEAAEAELAGRGHTESSVYVNSEISWIRSYFLHRDYAKGMPLLQLTREIPGSLPPRARR
jgi:hypothetical protein